MASTPSRSASQAVKPFTADSARASDRADRPRARSCAIQARRSDCVTLERSRPMPSAPPRCRGEEVEVARHIAAIGRRPCWPRAPSSAADVSASRASAARWPARGQAGRRRQASQRRIVRSKTPAKKASRSVPCAALNWCGSSAPKHQHPRQPALARVEPHQRFGPDPVGARRRRCAPVPGTVWRRTTGAQRHVAAARQVVADEARFGRRAARRPGGAAPGRRRRPARFPAPGARNRRAGSAPRRSPRPVRNSSKLAGPAAAGSRGAPGWCRRGFRRPPR